MGQLSGAVLVEIVGQDVVAWRILHDERHYLYSIDTREVPAVLMADAAGPLVPTVVQAENRTIVEFKKRSPFYAMLYRRNGFVEAQGDSHFYSDNWRFDSQRLHAWLFPRHAVFDSLSPPELRPLLTQWQEQPLVQIVTPSLWVEAEYAADPASFAAAGLPAGVPPTLADVAAALDLPGGLTTVEALRQATAGQPGIIPTLAGTTWLAALILGTTPASTPGAGLAADADTLWYFAYGANMAAAVLARRGVRPRESVAATLEGYALRFNHPGMPPVEPVFATIAPDADATVYGVAQCITAEEAAIFDRLEPGYHRVSVPLRLADGRTLAGYAYVSDSPGVDGIPSARYLGLLIDGARENQLPAEVIADWERLRALARQVVPPPTVVPPETVTPAPPGTPGLPADLVAEWQRQAPEKPS